MKEIINTKIISISIQIDDYNTNKLSVIMKISNGFVGAELSLEIEKLIELFRVANVSKYGELNGSYVRVEIDNNIVRAVGSILGNIWLKL